MQCYLSLLLYLHIFAFLFDEVVQSPYLCIVWGTHTCTLLKIRKLGRAAELIHCVRSEKKREVFSSFSLCRPSFTFEDSLLNPRSSSSDLPHTPPPPSFHYLSGVTNTSRKKLASLSGLFIGLSYSLILRRRLSCGGCTVQW
jgi:hypothetical protein